MPSPLLLLSCDSWMFVKENPHRKKVENQGKVFSYISVWERKIALPGSPQTSKMESFAAIVNPGYASVVVCTNFWVTTQNILECFSCETTIRDGF